MAKIIYNLNDGLGWYEDLAEAVYDFVEENEHLEYPIVLDLHKCEKVSYLASDFTPFFSETILERAYDQAGEHSENWLDKKDCESLDDYLETCIDKWADKHNKKPNFFTIMGEHLLDIKIYSCDEFEILRGL